MCGSEMHIDVYNYRLKIQSPGGMFESRPIVDCNINTVGFGHPQSGHYWSVPRHEIYGAPKQRLYVLWWRMWITSCMAVTKIPRMISFNYLLKWPEVLLRINNKVSVFRALHWVAIFWLSFEFAWASTQSALKNVNYNLITGDQVEGQVAGQDERQDMVSWRKMPWWRLLKIFFLTSMTKSKSERSFLFSCKVWRRKIRLLISAERPVAQFGLLAKISNLLNYSKRSKLQQAVASFLSKS